MFHNPFNSKIVEDITKFLQENRVESNIQPCLDEKAKEAADVISSQIVLEERRNILVKLFNEAVSSCGCRGTSQEASDFAKAVELHIENKKIVVPAKKVSEPKHTANELETPKSVKKKTANPSAVGEETAESDADLSEINWKRVGRVVGRGAQGAVIGGLVGGPAGAALGGIAGAGIGAHTNKVEREAEKRGAENARKADAEKSKESGSGNSSSDKPSGKGCPGGKKMVFGRCPK
jgi:hypothetical protein